MTYKNKSLEPSLCLPKKKKILAQAFSLRKNPLYNLYLYKLLCLEYTELIKPLLLSFSFLLSS